MEDGSGVALWVPVASALIAGVIGLVGGAGIRLVFDRRQELVRAQAFGRVILDELESIGKRLSIAIEEADTSVLAYPLPIDAWEAHRSDVAGVLLYEEFLALTQTYRAVDAFNHEAAAFFSSVGPTDTPPALEGHLAEQAHVTRLMVTNLGVPCISWLAREKLPFFKRRRVQPVLTPDPEGRCRCGHRWDSHRWEWRRRSKFRFRHRSYLQRSIANECNVRGCSCRRFVQVDADWRLLRRLRLAPQVAYLIGNEQEPFQRDPSIPTSAQPGALVAEDESRVIELRDPPQGQ